MLLHLVKVNTVNSDFYSKITQMNERGLKKLAKNIEHLSKKLQ